MITGAAARISQEVACIDKLIETKGLIINQEDTLLAGFSSGSLNLLALNACFRSDNPLSWETDYKEDVLWSLTNAKVIKKYEGIHIPIFDTAPLRVTLDGFLNKMGATVLGDLPFKSYILTFSDRNLKTEWATQFGSENQSGLVASDLFMASTAIPIAFPHQEIANAEGMDRNFPNGHFSDGGTGGQFKHFESHIGEFVKTHGRFETLHIISPMREEGTAELDHLKSGFSDQGIDTEIKGHLSHFASNLSFNAFMKFLLNIQDWQTSNGPLADQIYVSIPDMPNNFGILDFNAEKAEYDATINWIEKNPNNFAVPLSEFIARHKSA